MCFCGRGPPGLSSLAMNSRPWQSSISVGITLELVRDAYSQDFPGGPAVKNPPCNAGT